MKHLVTLVLLLISVFNLSAQEKETIIEITVPEQLPDPAGVPEVSIFTIVQEMPKYPEGETEMWKFIENEMRYPAEAKEKGIQGVVYLKLIINEDGCIDTNDIDVMRELHPALDNEAVRIVKQMPCWTPGYQRGEPVRVYYNLPIRFVFGR